MRTAVSGVVPPLDFEALVLRTGLVRWCALVGAPLAVSASATVLVVQLAARHPQTGAPLKWGAELRVALREAIVRSRFASLAGTVRILEHAAPCPSGGRAADTIDREALRVWAAQRLRRMGAEKLRMDDRMDSAERLKIKKKD